KEIVGIRSAGADYALIEHAGTSGPSPASSGRCSLLVHVIGGLCGSPLRPTEPWTVSPHAQRLLGRHPADARAGVAATQSRCCSVTDRVLAVHLFDLCHLGRLRVGARLGSRQLHHTAGGRNCSRDRLSRDRHQRRDVLGCAGGSHFAGAHSLGPSHRAPSVSGRIAGTRNGSLAEITTRPRSVQRSNPGQTKVAKHQWVISRNGKQNGSSL